MINKNMGKTAVLIIILAVVLTGGLLVSQVGNEQETGPIQIGFIGPLTGDAAIYGLEDQNAVMLAVEEINKSGGIHGRELEIIYEDGKCNGKDSVSAAQKLIEIDKIKFILGGTCSGETLAIAPITEKNEILLFSSYSNSPDITEAGDFVFRNAPSDLDSARATADLALRNGVKTASILAENTSYGEGFARVFKDRFEERGGKVLSDEFYQPGTTDFRSLVSKVVDMKPDAVLVSPQDAKGGTLIKQLRGVGFRGSLYGNVVSGGAAVAEAARGAAEGLYYSDAASLSEEDPLTRDFLSLYNNKFGKQPDYSYYAGARYDAVHVLAEAIEKVGTNPERVRDYLYNVKYSGVLGAFGFDENGDVEGIKFADYQIKNGKAEIISVE